MQNLTPLEIQKQTFARALKGYHPDEVRAYLHLVAEEIERLVRENDRAPARERRCCARTSRITPIASAS
jgi:DivIVA domain-containing protein